MPEIVKLPSSEAGPSGEEPGIGAKKTAEDSNPAFGAQASSFPTQNDSFETGDFEKPASARVKDVRPAETKDDSGAKKEESVSRNEDKAPEEAGESVETSEPQAESQDDELAGLEGGEIHDLSVEEELVSGNEPVAEHDHDGEDQRAEEPFEAIAGHHSLSEIALASGSLAEFDRRDASLSSKQDDLADAVQAALASMYGETSARAHGPERHAIAHSQPESSRWRNDDNLSPQDVILNYFDYEPGQAEAPRTLPSHNGSRYDPEAYARPNEYLSEENNASWADPASTHGYDELSETAGGFPQNPEVAERQSNRLLGAAAIGLVSGIAIAATLAVFVISSYGPGALTPSAANATSDAAETGYGPWGKGNSAASDPLGNATKPSLTEMPISIATADISAVTGQPSSLAIQVRPEQVDGNTLISITGVPEGARLNAGVDAGGGNWLLPPRRLSGLTINLPSGAPDPAVLGVQALDSTLRNPLSEKQSFTIHVNEARTEPVATLPDQLRPPQGAASSAIPGPRNQAAVQEPAKPAASFFSTQTVAEPVDSPRRPAPQVKPAQPGLTEQGAPSRQTTGAAASNQQRIASRTETDDLIREGDRRLREGDLLEARQIYQKAVLLGDAEAALAMGRSYDPVYVARLDRKNAEADAAKAFDWYRRAMEGGASQTAKARIEKLMAFLNQ